MTKLEKTWHNVKEKQTRQTIDSQERVIIQGVSDRQDRKNRQSIPKKELSYRVCQNVLLIFIIKNYFLAFKAVSIKIPYVFYMPISFSLGKFAISLI